LIVTAVGIFELFELEQLHHPERIMLNHKVKCCMCFKRYPVIVKKIRFKLEIDMNFLEQCCTFLSEFLNFLVVVNNLRHEFLSNELNKNNAILKLYLPVPLEHSRKP
jgi:hypothetical protein